MNTMTLRIIITGLISDWRFYNFKIFSSVQRFQEPVPWHLARGKLVFVGLFKIDAFQKPEILQIE